MARSSHKRTITPAEFAHYAATHDVKVIYPDPHKPQPKGADEMIQKGALKLRTLLARESKDGADCLGRTLLSSFVATLGEDQSTLLLVTLFGVPGLGEMLDRHLENLVVFGDFSAFAVFAPPETWARYRALIEEAHAGRWSFPRLAAELAKLREPAAPAPDQREPK